MAARLNEIEERESAVSQREAQIEADVDIRMDRLERKELELADLEVRLDRKERDLAVYVGNLQAQGRVLTPDDSDWWAKQPRGTTPALSTASRPRSFRDERRGQTKYKGTSIDETDEVGF